MSKKTDDSFAEFIRDQLQDLDEVTLRRMFGGYGIYAGSQFFAILLAGRLYFKTDSQSRVRYTERGMEALRATAKQVLTNYYEVPPDVVEEPEQLASWARRAIAVGSIRRAHSVGARRQPTKKSYRQGSQKP
jgi:DNA transformation protein and related proteins